jgi:hypothetical protein
VVRQPALIAGEIAWRWAFGVAAWALVFLTLRQVFAGVDVSEAEYYLARRSSVFLIADACARVLVQVLPGVARAALIVAPALAVLWIVAATLGRMATLRTLAASAERRRRVLAPLLAIHLVRALFTLAALAAFFGTIVLTARAFPNPADPVAVSALWILFAALVAMCWSVVNWFLSLAPIFVMRDGRGAWDSISDSLALFRRSPGAYSSAAFWFGLFRGVALLAAFVLALVTAASASSAAAGVAVSIVIALIYFAAADFLYIARLAAYVALGESGQPSAVSSPPGEPAPAAIAELPN